MTDVPEPWRLEIEEVLAEIAADPKARLLRVPPVDDLLALADQGPVGVMAPSLTKAERYLLQTHRQELAYLLRERCVMEFYAQPDAELWWHRSVTVDREAAIADAPGWNGRVDEACSTTIRDARSRDTTRVLVECTVRTPPSPVGIVQLAAASVRIAPSLEADLYVALEFLRKGQFQVSRRHCRRVLETSPSSLLRSMAWENLAYAYVSEENRPEGAAAYRRAFEVSPSRVSPAVFWLTNCIIGGDVTGASCAARAVEEAVPIGHPVIGWAENSLLLFRRKARREALETARSALVEARNENVARIVNAFRS